MKLANKNSCTGCTACKCACPKDAITMRPNSLGFVYPVVDNRKCVNCGRCEKVCPVLHPFKRDDLPLACYAAQSNSDAVRMASASGGIFYEVAKKVIAGGGVVYGCVWDDLVARHCRTETLDGLDRMRGSKYVQSDLRNVLREVVADVVARRHVLFSGTPCQIAAVNRLVGKDNPFLLTIDLICHSVSSPRLLEKYKKYLVRTARSGLTGINFRSKEPSWKKFNVRATFADSAKDRSLFSRMNPYCRLIFPLIQDGDVCGRLSCFNCHHKQGASGADLTIGDFWGIERVSEWEDDDTGTSAVVVHSAKGARAIDSLDQINKLPVLPEKVFDGNGAYVRSCPPAAFLSFWQRLVMLMPMEYAYCVPCLRSKIHELKRRIAPSRIYRYLKRHLLPAK